ncbi:hypothetical protein AAKU64_004420 [Undibacterium sp. GrIS 1.8]|uniref:hypothetical protein n=1 Tax=Undibacterium sp. GrIS 1.8 TaxID=3143934 RepID=UPI0033913804
MHLELDSKTAGWGELIGMNPALTDWVLNITLSTVPIEYWFYARNKLKPEDLSVELLVPSYGLCCAELTRNDRVFQVQWRPNNEVSVDSQQMKYRRLVKWPSLNSLRDFPEFVLRLEDVLGIKFIRHANVGGRNVPLEMLLEKESRFSAWLKPCAETTCQHMTTESHGKE